MEVERPAPSEELNLEGEPTTPRVAASVIVLRGDDEGLEVLLVRRTPHARFMAGVWVFPGGAVDAGEDVREAAVRELREEAAVVAEDPAALLPFSRWITPAQVRIRYDTWFFLTPAPPGARPAVDGQECVAVAWWAPADALAAYAHGELTLVLPTIKHLEQLSAFSTAAQALEHARGREVHPIQPHVIGEGETARIVLPGEPGHPEG